MQTRFGGMTLGELDGGIAAPEVAALASGAAMLAGGAPTSCN